MLDFYKTTLFLNYGLLSTVVFLMLWKYTVLSKREKQYVYYIVFFFLIEVINLFFAYVVESEDALFLYPYFIAGEFLLLATLYSSKNNFSKYLSSVIILIVIIFLVVSNFTKLFINYDFVKVTSNIIITCLIGLALIRQIKNGENRDAFGLVDVGLFFYYSVSVLIFVIQSQIVNLSIDSVYLLMGINNVLLTFLYCSIVYTLIKLKK